MKAKEDHLMHRRYRMLIVTVMSLAMLAGTGCSPQSTRVPTSTETAEGETVSTGISVDYPYSENIRGLARAADTIVVGDVLATEKRDININVGPDKDLGPTIHPYTVSTVKVRRVIKGTVSKGDVIEVKQLVEAGGRAAKLKDKGLRGVLFLESYSNGIPYSFVNPEQGALLLEGGRTKTAQGNPLYQTQRSESDVVDELEELVK